MIPLAALYTGILEVYFPVALCCNDMTSAEYFAKKCGKVLTVEEHNIIGGLGEAVCSCLSEKYPVPVKRVGVNDEFGHSGPAGALLKAFGLCADNIVAQTKALLGK